MAIAFRRALAPRRWRFPALDSVRPDPVPMLRLTQAVLELGARVRAGDLKAIADAEALADLLCPVLDTAQ